MKTCASFYDGTKEKEDLIIDLATQTQDGLMSKEDKTKLDGLTGTGGGTIDSIDASKVVQDSTHKFVTDVQIAAWDAKASTDKAEAGTKDGLMSKEDKTKLDGIDPLKIPNTATLKSETKTIEFTNSNNPESVLFSVDLSALFS